MIQKIRDYIRQYQIIRPQDHIICGVSGGADSVCLFLVLKKLQKELDFTMEVVHVEHGIRGEESCKDMEFTQELCRKYEVSCTVVRVDVPAFCKEHGAGTEEAARILRYRAFSRRAGETGGKVALAHHMEDNAETVLFQLLRGSGVKGMSGMSPVRVEQNISFIRPLLAVTRHEIEVYLELLGQQYCMDSTNTDVTYDRNRLRHMVLPQLIEINSQAVAHINQTAGMMAEAWDYISQSANRIKPQIMEERSDGVHLDTIELKKLHSAIRNEIILDAIAAASGKRKDIMAIHVTSVADLLDKQSGRRINLPYRLTALKQYDEIIIFREDWVSEGRERILIDAGMLESCKEQPLSIQLKQGVLLMSYKTFHGNMDEIPKKPYTKWVDYDKIKRGFSIRKRMSGDYFINDIHGHRKKLKQYFIDEKVPASMRDEIWLIAMDNQIIDIIGGRMAEPFKVSSDTTEILEMQFDGGN